jgi:ketosteroid isomerase-like protein
MGKGVLHGNVQSASRTEGVERGLFAFAAALSSTRVGEAAAWLSRECCLVTPDGTVVHGRNEVRQVLAQLAARRAEIAIDQLVVRAAGDVAHAVCRWKITSDGPEATRFVQVCNSTVVLQKLEDEWRLAILSPWR